MNIRLDGKTALVCGASQGIGRACAHLLAGQGARIILLARNQEALESLRKELPNASQHRTVSVDLSNIQKLEDSIKNLLQEIPNIHILVNNSGGPAMGKLLDAENASFIEVFTQHLLASQTLSRLLVPGMIQAQYGRIINIISTSVKSPLSNLGVSNTIRGAVANWAKTLANEIGPYGITVNNVLPGATLTGRLKGLMEISAQKSGKSLSEIEAEWLVNIPLKRYAQPEDVASAVCFLASPAACHVTGINLPVDGGRTPSL